MCKALCYLKLSLKGGGTATWNVSGSEMPIQQPYNSKWIRPIDKGGTFHWA